MLEIFFLLGLFYVYVAYAVLFAGLFPVALAQKEKNPSISVILPSKNDHSVLGKTLSLLRKSDYPLREVIIVDASDGKGIKAVQALAKKYGVSVVKDTEKKARKMPSLLVQGRPKASSFM